MLDQLHIASLLDSFTLAFVRRLNTLVAQEQWLYFKFASFARVIAKCKDTAFRL